MTLSFSKENIEQRRFVEKIHRGLVKFGPYNSYKEFQKYSLLHEQKFDVGFGTSNVKSKIHTIRADKKDRWKAGNKIHFVKNNRTKDRFQFAPVLKVKSIQHIEIVYRKKLTFLEGVPYRDVLVNINGQGLGYCTIHPSNGGLTNDSDLDGLIKELAINDGFDCLKDFFNYFNTDFEGKIIHWTDFKY